MVATLNELEEHRKRLYQELEAVGDFRPGMISVNYRKCGKVNCACARPGQRGHGPQYLWNTTQHNQSRSQVIQVGPELLKVEGELAHYRRFMELCGELVKVNEQICRLRPVLQVGDEKELAQLKKTLQQMYSRRRRKRTVR
jgi:hypothetical protein